MLEPMDGDIHIKTQQLDSDEEQVVEEQHLSPQTLLETPDGGMITYRVLQVEDQDDDGSSQMETSDLGSHTVVRNSNQIYVIGNSNDIFQTHDTKNIPIAPRSSVLMSDIPIVTQVKKRDERRRATHNEVERRRRDKINNWITKLSKILPDSHSDKPSSQYDGNSKGGILSRAFEYILELQCSESKLDSCMKENKKLAQAVQTFKAKNLELERENRELREILKRHGIEVTNAR